MKILITGSSGFIGSHLIKRLNPIHEISTYDIKDNKDILDKDALSENMKKVNIVIHLAALVKQAESWKKTDSYLITNGLGTFKVLEAAEKNKVSRVILLSSAAVYAKPLTPYGLSKRFAEEACYMYDKLETVILRPFNAYGKSQNLTYNYAIHNFIRDIKNKGIVNIYGDGNQTRDFIFIDDLVTVIEHFLTSTPPKNPLDVGTGNEITINELAICIGKILKKDFKINYLRERKEPYYSKANISLLKKSGIKIDKFRNIEEGLRIIMNKNTRYTI